MQPKKAVEPSKELESEKLLLIGLPGYPPPDNQPPVKVYSPDELDAAQKRAERQANELLADAALQEIHDKGILPPDAADHPYTVPNTQYGFYHKVVYAPRYRLLRIISLIVFLILLALLMYSKYTYDKEYNKTHNSLIRKTREQSVDYS